MKVPDQQHSAATSTKTSEQTVGCLYLARAQLLTWAPTPADRDLVRRSKHFFVSFHSLMSSGSRWRVNSGQRAHRHWDDRSAMTARDEVWRRQPRFRLAGKTEDVRVIPLPSIEALMAKKKLRIRRRYLAEFNRCVGDNIERVIRRLQRLGYDVERVPQLTAVRITPPRSAAFQQLKADLQPLLQPRRGSLILASTSGRMWSCSMRGNQPGDFVRIL